MYAIHLSGILSSDGSHPTVAVIVVVVLVVVAAVPMIVTGHCKGTAAPRVHMDG